MSIEKITQSEVNGKKVSGMAYSPSESSLYGTNSMTKEQIRERFDKLPLLLVEKINKIIDIITQSGDENILADLDSGLGTDTEKKSVAEFLSDIHNGNIADYFFVSEDETLGEFIQGITEKIATLLNSTPEAAQVQFNLYIDTGRLVVTYANPESEGLYRINEQGYLEVLI